MNKLLRLFFTLHFKAMAKNLGLSLILTLGIMVIMGTSVEKFPLILSGLFFAFNTLFNETRKFFGDNLSWMIIAPISKKKILLYQFVTASLALILTYIAPAIVFIACFIPLYFEKIRNFALDSGVSQAVMRKIILAFSEFSFIPSSVIAFTLTFIFFHFIACIVFGKSKMQPSAFLLNTQTKKGKMLFLGLIFANIILIQFFSASILYVTTMIIFLVSFNTLINLKRDLVLSRVTDRHILGIPVVLSLAFFGSLKIYSDHQLSSPKTSMIAKLQEIEFQMKFSDYLDEKRVVEFLHSGLQNKEYSVLTEVYEEWPELKNSLNSKKDLVFTKLIQSQKDPRVLTQILTIFDAKNLNVMDVEQFLSQYNKVHKGAQSLPILALQHLSQVKMGRSDLMNYLVSADPLKQMLAVSFAKNTELNLGPEIVKSINNFNDRTLEQAKAVLSLSLCRSISTVEVMNAHKAEKYSLKNDCKFTKERLPASK